MKKTTKTVFCCTAFGAALLFSTGATAASPGALVPHAAGLTAASPQLCEFYQKKFDAILTGAVGSIDAVIRNATSHGCIIKGV